MTRKRERIGEILRRLSQVGEKEIEEALDIQREKGHRIGEILLRSKQIKEVDMLKALSIQFQIPFLQNLTEEEIDKALVSSVRRGDRQGPGLFCPHLLFKETHPSPLSPGK
ncbi:MAG: hypothetical protein HZB32_03920 [Nitrospirae bacterium]|nr:hypothetical protein [Nitrospirota bacterium]